MKLQLRYFCLVMLLAFAASRNVPTSKLINSRNIGKFVMISDFHYDLNQSSKYNVSDILCNVFIIIIEAVFGQDSPLWLINITVFSLADIVRRYYSYNI